jgi:hypothetical protein
LENPLWKSIDTSGMAPDEAVKIWQREYSDALASGDRDRIENAFRSLELANMAASAPQPFTDPIDQETRELGEQGRRRDEIERKTKGATKYLFEEWSLNPFNGFKGPEAREFDAINKTVESATRSGNPSQFNAAQEFSDIISRYGLSDKAGKPYDEADTFNSLAKFSGDMLGMLNALRSLVEKIDGVQVDVTSGP